MHTCEHASWHPFKQAGMSRYHPPTTTTTAENKNELAISKSSRGLGLVACLEGQKINNMPNILGSFPTFLKLFVQPETQQL